MIEDRVSKFELRGTVNLHLHGTVFPEYVLPSLSWLTQDQEVIVRIAYAENIASLAETALKLLEMAQLDYANQENNEDDDSLFSIRYYYFFRGQDWLWVNSVFLYILNYFQQIMHQKFPFMCELCNIFKQIC